MGRYLISIIRPKGYQHSNAFLEVAQTLLQGLRDLGHESAILENTVDPQAVNIVLGAHLLNDGELEGLPRGTIIYNLEQLGSPFLGAGYMQLGSRHQIWEYSPINLAIWQQLPNIFKPALVEIGYSPILKHIPVAPVQDIDVLFYGSINERRKEVLEKLRRAGINLNVNFGVYGQQRDGLIARSKIVLNIHYYEAKLFEVVRVSYLLANSKAVVSETSADKCDYEQAVAAFSYPDLVDGCLAVLNDEPRRKMLEARGYEFVSRKPITQILAGALA